MTNAAVDACQDRCQRQRTADGTAAPDDEVSGKLRDVDRLLNDPEVAWDPAKVWSLLADVAGQSVAAHGGSAAGKLGR